METIVVRVPSKKDRNFILELLSRLGYSGVTTSDSQTDARNKLASLIRKSKSANISMDDISEVVERVRAKRYGNR
ncbi:MAG TPA: hypothetical protein VE978_14340 [Chitinophagales bacterium]|nr:hypothetical protein [Chitinophagales bacterium]